MSANKIVHVAVAVIKNQHGQIFIAKRHKESHQGDLWEFPGGKVEDNETVLEALKRELLQETGITLIQASPLIRIHHDYDDKSVLLDVWCVDEYTGKAFGKEGQKACWTKQDEFSLYDFPAANLPIITAVQLPDKYMITGSFNDEEDFLTKLQSNLDNNIKLIQFRAHHLDVDEYFAYAKKAYEMCEKVNASLLLNTSVDNFKKYQAHKYCHGLHLNTKELRLFSKKQIDSDLLLSASIHNNEELLLAHQNNFDFAVLSPVKKTLSHPDSLPLGWDDFYQLTEKSTLPIYALGGMTESDLKIAKEKGAQGIAAIGAFWGI
jgi:8-oxo-dGTP diphosphatase